MLPRTCQIGRPGECVGDRVVKFSAGERAGRGTPRSVPAANQHLAILEQSSGVVGARLNKTAGLDRRGSVRVVQISPSVTEIKKLAGEKVDSIESALLRGSEAESLCDWFE